MPSSTAPRAALGAIGTAVALVLSLSACSTTPPKSAEAVAAAPAMAEVATTDDVLASASVGDDVFVLLRHGGTLRSAASLRGGVPKENDVDHNWSLVTPSTSLEAAEVTRLDGGSYPDERVSTLVGQVGDAVTGVEVVTGASSRTTASISHGFFVAAWKGDDLTDAGSSIVVHLEDGSSRTIPYGDLTTAG